MCPWLSLDCTQWSVIILILTLDRFQVCQNSYHVGCFLPPLQNNQYVPKKSECLKKYAVETIEMIFNILFLTKGQWAYGSNNGHVNTFHFKSEEIERSNPKTHYHIIFGDMQNYIQTS